MEELRAKLNELQAGKPANERMLLNARQQEIMEEYKKMEAAFKENSKKARIRARERIEALEQLHGITNSITE